MTDDLKLVGANIFEGAVGHDWTHDRFEAVLDLLAEQDADAIAIQEALYWTDNDDELLKRAEKRLGMHGFIAREGSDLHPAILVKPRLRITRTEHLPTNVWRHGAVLVVVETPGDRRLTLGSAHLSVGSPAQRFLEAEQLTSYFKPEEPTVLLLDSNNAEWDTELGHVPQMVASMLALPGTRTPDTRPIDRLIERGFVDLAARTEHTRLPTTAGTRAVHVRADRILADPETAVVAGDVELIDTRGVSDHLWTSTVLSL